VDFPPKLPGWYLAAMKISLCLIPLLVLSCGSQPASDQGPVQIAVASNFQSTAKQLAKAFQLETGQSVSLSAGSTGKHYAQIVHGAPFDLYFAADVDRPRRLEEQGIGVAGSRFTYAVGRLVLWTAKDGVDLSGGLLAPVVASADNGQTNQADPVDQINQTDGISPWPHLKVRHFAIANPQAAPYGKAAKEVMESMGIWSAWQAHLVRGENIGQAFQFVQSANAEIGLVAASQVQGAGGTQAPVPMDQYQALEQQALQLTERPAAASFLEFVRSARGRSIIEGAGYLTSLD
jgi:molybdate transport system substrate-binding protein